MKTITTKELQTLQSTEPGLPIINTLPRDAFEKTRIPGAISIPQDDPEFADRVARAVGAKTDKLVVYCANKQCDSSEKATKKLEERASSRYRLTKVGRKRGKKKPAHRQPQHR